MVRCFRRLGTGRGVVLVLALSVAGAVGALAHPGSGIVVDARGRVFFTDTGQGVWKLDPQGNLTLISTLSYHWMALDPNGHRARSRALGSFDGGSFERIPAPGDVPGLILSSDYPIAVGNDGGLYYVPYSTQGPRQLIRRTPAGQRSVFSILPAVLGERAVRWVNGITTGPDGALYVTDDDAIRRIDRGGAVVTIRSQIRPPDCADPLPDTPNPAYLRGLAVAPDGTMYVAANNCRSVIRIPATGPIQTVLIAERPWSTTGVALSGDDLYVLEYLHTPGETRREWVPRVRKIGAGGSVETLAVIERPKK